MADMDIFKEFEEIKEVIHLYPPPHPPMRKLTELDGEKKKLYDCLRLANLV